MKYFDDKEGRIRETLEHYLLPGETEETLLFPDGPHDWQLCRHEGVGQRGSVGSCQVLSRYLRYCHYVCFRCGTERYPERWGDIVTKILEDRRDYAERSSSSAVTANFGEEATCPVKGE